MLSEKKIHFLAESFIKMSRLEHRIIQIRPLDTDLLLTLSEAVSQAEEKARRRGLQICTRFPETLFHPHDADWLGDAVIVTASVYVLQPVGKFKNLVDRFSCCHDVPAINWVILRTER